MVSFATLGGGLVRDAYELFGAARRDQRIMDS